MARTSSPRESPAAAGKAITPAYLGELARGLGLELDTRQCESLIAYTALLRRWNRVHNLTAIAGESQMLTHHLLDCLAIVCPLERALAQHAIGPLPHRPLHLLDAGSGAGLPGIALAIARPSWRVTLVDAVQKKCAFLVQARVELGLSNVHVVHARLQTCALPAHDLVVSRAFASLADFVDATRSLLAPGGLWAAMKGRVSDDEIGALPAGIVVLDAITLHVPLLEAQRALILMRSAPAPAVAHGAPRPS